MRGELRISAWPKIWLQSESEPDEVTIELRWSRELLRDLFGWFERSAFSCLELLLRDDDLLRRRSVWILSSGAAPSLYSSGIDFICCACKLLKYPEPAIQLFPTGGGAPTDELKGGKAIGRLPLYVQSASSWLRMPQQVYVENWHIWVAFFPGLARRCVLGGFITWAQGPQLGHWQCKRVLTASRGISGPGLRWGAFKKQCWTWTVDTRWMLINWPGRLAADMTEIIVPGSGRPTCWSTKVTASRGKNLAKQSLAIKYRRPFNEPSPSPMALSNSTPAVQSGEICGTRPGFWLISLGSFDDR